MLRLYQGDFGCWVFTPCPALVDDLGSNGKVYHMDDLGPGPLENVVNALAERGVFADLCKKLLVIHVLVYVAINEQQRAVLADYDAGFPKLKEPTIKGKLYGLVKDISAHLFARPTKALAMAHSLEWTRELDLPPQHLVDEIGVVGGYIYVLQCGQGFSLVQNQTADTMSSWSQATESSEKMQGEIADLRN